MNYTQTNLDFMKIIRFTLLSCLCLTGLLMFTGCGSKNSFVANKELPKQIEARATTPANLSVEDATFYKMGKAVATAFTNRLKDEQVLYKIGNVTITYELTDDINNVVTEDEVKAKFELALRRNNIPIVTTDGSPSIILSVKVSGYLNKDALFVYNTQIKTFELQPLYRNGEWRYALVSVWEKGGHIGTAPKPLAGDAILTQIEKAAEVFANDYLAANPSK